MLNGIIHPETSLITAEAEDKCTASYARSFYLLVYKVKEKVTFRNILKALDI